MMISLSNILSRRAVIETEEVGISDAMLSVEGRRLAYMVLDTRTWFENRFALMHVNTIDKILPDAKVLPLRARRADLEGAPALSSDDTLFATDFMTSLPPIVIGPFGGTISPLVMASALPGAPSQGDERAQVIDTRFARFSDLKGMDVFGKDGQLGGLQDVFISASNFEVTVLQVTNSKQASAGPMLVPSDKLQHMADQETHLVLDVTTNELVDATRFGAATVLTSRHLSKLDHYYYQ